MQLNELIRDVDGARDVYKRQGGTHSVLHRTRSL